MDGVSLFSKNFYVSCKSETSIMLQGIFRSKWPYFSKVFQNIGSLTAAAGDGGGSDFGFVDTPASANRALIFIF